jgi:hypothetical protein
MINRYEGHSAEEDGSRDSVRARNLGIGEVLNLPLRENLTRITRSQAKYDLIVLPEPLE